MDDARNNDSPAGDAAPILSYQSTALRPGKAVTVGQYPDAVYASIDSARLTAEEIDNHVLNANVNGLGIPYRGWSSVELQVHEADAARARAVLQSQADDLEPAEESPEAAALDDEGEPVALAIVAAFDTVREMREAMTLLASARIRAIPPTLLRRGDAPPGQGKRFILRVNEADLERGQSLLAQADTDSQDDDEPRCPKCNSWRTYPVPRMLRIVLAIVGNGKWPPVRIECLACRYRGSPGEFEPRHKAAPSR